MRKFAKLLSKHVDRCAIRNAHETKNLASEQTTQSADGGKTPMLHERFFSKRNRQLLLLLTLLFFCGSELFRCSSARYFNLLLIQ